MLSEVLDKEIGGTIEGQSLAALITLLDKLGEDCEGLSGELYALHRGMHGRVCGCGRIRRRERAWHRSK